MPWILYPIPSNTKSFKPTVRLSTKKGSRALSISKEAIALTGFAQSDPLVVEHDEANPNLHRIRRPQGNEPRLGTLSMDSKARSGQFATGGRVLMMAGFDAGVVDVECGPGWLTFDATPLRPRPWTLRIGSDKALAVLRGLVTEQPMKKVIDYLDVEVEDVNAVRELVGDLTLGELRGASEPQRHKEYARILSRWKVSEAVRSA